MTRGKGLSIVGGVIVGEFRQHLAVAEEARKRLKNKLREARVDGRTRAVSRRFSHAPALAPRG